MLTLNLAPEIETHLRTLAQKQGLEPTTYAENLLANVLPVIAEQNKGQSQDWHRVAQRLKREHITAETLTSAERLAAFREWVALPRRVFPALSDEALSRDSIYGERG